MDKTIDNIKKFLHIKKNKSDAVDNKGLNIKVELSKEIEEISHYEPVNIVGTNVPIEVDDEDVETSDDSECCQACNKGMTINEVSLSNGLRWHYACFSCYQCGKDLSKQKYAYERDCLMCHACLTSRVKTICYRCNNTINIDDTKLIVDGHEFHETCFSCVSCNVQLDKVYGKKDETYYCEPCYIEKFGKRCHGCSEVILGEGLRFGDVSFHKNCFNCSLCGTLIPQPGPVHSIKGSPACESCYENQFTETCLACKDTVQEGLKFRDKRFHATCFQCSQCNENLAERKGDFLLTDDDGLICKDCIKQKMNQEEEKEKKENAAENCSACQLPIHVKNLVFDGDSSWHYRCFTCSKCNLGLVNEKYYEKSDTLFCTNCFLAQYLPTCYQCREEIKGDSGVKMTAKTGMVLTWHQSCLQCCTCSIQPIQLDNVVFKEDKLFCKKCYLDKVMEKCNRCMQPITGAAFSFRGKIWHDRCFGCDNCGEIFDQGKFRNLRDQKLCEECFKNRLNVSIDE